MKKLFALVLVLLLLLLCGCSKGYSKYFSEPVDFEYLNGGKELSDLEFYVNIDKEVFEYEPITISVSETFLLKDILDDYEFEYIVPGEPDNKKGKCKYVFESTLTDNPISGTEVFYLDLGENLVSAGVTEIGIYENAVYIFIDVEPCGNPEDFSAEEFDFGPNYLFFTSYDEELVARISELCEKIEERVPASVELSEEEFYAYAKKKLGYTDEQLDKAILAGLPQTLILRPESHGSISSWRVTSDGKYEVGLFWWGAEFKIPYNDGTKDYYFESTFFLPYLKDHENGTFRFIPEFEFDQKEYDYHLIGNECVSFKNGNGIRIYNLTDVSEPSAEIKTEENGERTRVLSSFSYGENLYIFKISQNNLDSYYYDSPLDYTDFYEIDVIGKDGKIVKTINTYVPWKRAYANGGPFDPKDVTTSFQEEGVFKFDIHGNYYEFDTKTETMTQLLPDDVEIFYEKDKNGKFALTKNGKAITEYIYDSISIEKTETYTDSDFKQNKIIYYAVCVFIDGTEKYLAHTDGYPEEPYYEELPNAKVDIYFEDGTLFNEKSLQSFSLYTLIPNYEYYGGYIAEKFTYRLSGYCDGVYYEYEKYEGEEDVFVKTETAENTVNEYGFTIAEYLHPFFGKRYGITDPDGKVILEPIYLRVQMPFEDRILVNVGRYYDYVAGELGKQFIIDTSKKMIAMQYDRIDFYFDKDGSYIGVAYTDERNMSYGEVRYWFIDKDGNKLGKIEKTNEGYILVKVDFESGKIIGIVDGNSVCEYEIGDYIQKP